MWKGKEKPLENCRKATELSGETQTEGGEQFSMQREVGEEEEQI